jgi:hypothetical protein
MFTIIFKFYDGSVTGHVCPSREVCGKVLEDVAHHAGGHIAAWIIGDKNGLTQEGSIHSHRITPDDIPQHMRVEWS